MLLLTSQTIQFYRDSLQKNKKKRCEFIAELFKSYNDSVLYSRKLLSLRTSFGWRGMNLTVEELVLTLLCYFQVDHGEEGDKKISLERLFTPATDSGDLTPRKSMSSKAR